MVKAAQIGAALLLCFALIAASPVAQQAVFDAAGSAWTQDAGNATMHALLEQYAPVFKLSIQERFFPSSIEYMLPHFREYEDAKGIKHSINEPLTPSSFDRLPLLPSTYLNIREPHNPQPILEREAEYLLGPAGRTGGRDEPGHDGRGRIKEVVYGFWVDQPHGVVDLWYWTYYPFNFGKPVGPFGFLGHHVSDWERLRVRTINGFAVSVDYNTHTGGRFSAGTFRWEDVPKMDDRPVAYVAAGSHGVWPNPGDHVYADILDVFKLVDVTDDYGPIWDTKGRVVPLQYRDPDQRLPLEHSGEESWLNYPGHWGNRGVDKCWWHRAVGYCQLIDAPPGPNRQLLVPPQCLLAPVRLNTSSYAFYLSEETVNRAEPLGITLIKVEQICARPKKRSGDGDEGGDDEEDEGESHAEDYGGEHNLALQRDKAFTLYNADGRTEDDFHIWSMTGSTPFRPDRTGYTVSVPACKGRRSAVKAYKLHLCTSGRKCRVQSDERKICTFEEGKPGFVSGQAVSFEDVDDWDLSF